MKKFLTLILALALTASLAACGNSNTPASSSGSASSGSAAGSGDASFTTAVDGVLSMATEATFPPYEYYDGDTIVGIDVEIAEEACARIGYEPIFVELDIDKGFELLDEDYVDCLWCCLTMEGNEDKFIWAGPYMYTQRVVVVPADSEIETLEDLAGKCVAVQAGSISEEIILKGLNPNLPEITDLSTFSTMGEVFTSLRKGYADAAIGHESSLRLYTDEYPDGYRYLNMNMYSDAVGVAFKPDGDAVLAEKLTQTLLEMREDGTMAAIVKKYGLDAEKNVNGGTE